MQFYQRAKFNSLLGRARLYGLFDFDADRSGTVAIIFALCLFSLGLTAGLAIDYGRGVNLQVSMQNDLDAALLGAAGRSAEGDEIEAMAQDFFDANWKKKNGVIDDVNSMLPDQATPRSAARQR